MIFPRFSQAEYARRYARVRELMAARSLDALVVYGDSSFQGSNHANVVWLANWTDPYMAYVLFPARGEPALYISNVLYRHTAVRAASVHTVEWGGPNPGRTIGERLRELGLAEGRIGTAGVRNVGRSSMPSEHFLALREVLPEATLEDGLELMQQARAVKSTEELEWFERGARLTDRAIEALAAGIRIGMPEHQLSTLVHQGVLGDGGRVMFHFIGATPMDEPEIIFPWQYPSCRPIATGDVILTEISASYWGYAGQIQRPFAVGRAPTGEYQTLFDVAAECYQRMLAAVRPGATDQDVRRAAAFIEAKGYRNLDAMAHGWGVTIEPPRIDPPSALIKREQTPATFEPGMLLVIQPHVVSADGRRGVQVGNLVAIERGGARSLQRYPLEFVRV